MSTNVSREQARNVQLFLTRIHLKPQVSQSLSRSGIISHVVPLSNVFDSIEEAERVLDLTSIRSGVGVGVGTGMQGRRTRTGTGTTTSGVGGGVGGGSGSGSAVGGWLEREIDPWRSATVDAGVLGISGGEARDVEAGLGGEASTNIAAAESSSNSTSRRAGHHADDAE